MAAIEVPMGEVAPKRREPGEVLHGEASGPSARGSTYWRRVMTCPREHLFANVLGWAPEGRSDALDTGLVWHYILESFYTALYNLQQKTGAAATLLDCEQAAFKTLHAYRDEPGYEQIFDDCERMLEVYLGRYGERDARSLEILSVETELTAREEHFGFEYSTRLDMIAIDREHDDEGLTRIYEHKSSRSLDPLITTGYTQDLQTLGQVWLASELLDMSVYPAFMGSFVNITTKHKTPLCERVPVQPSEDQLAAWEEQMRYWTAYERTLTQVDYPKNYAHCTRRFGRCPYFELCRVLPDVSAEDWRKRDEAGAVPPGYQRKNA